MVKKILDYISPQSGCVYVDTTFGTGNCSRILLESCKNCIVIAMDRDRKSFKYGMEMMKIYDGRFYIFNSKFSRLDYILKLLKICKVDGIIFDLGFSNLQVNYLNSGFSFKLDSILDMRFSSEIASLAYILENFDNDYLSRIIFFYSELLLGSLFKSKNCVRSVRDFIDIFMRSAGFINSNKFVSRFFMGFRMFVNSELWELHRSIKCVDRILVNGGRFVILSFNSLEDILVKEFLDFEFAIGCFKKFKRSFFLYKKEAVRSGEERYFNFSSRLAKLRVAIKI